MRHEFPQRNNREVRVHAFGKGEVTISEIYKRGWRVVSAVQISGSQAHTLSLVIEEQPKFKK